MADRAKDLDDLLRGDPDKWLISTREIEAVILTETCRHRLPRIDACQDCFVSALLRRQMASLARRIGCTDEVAEDVSDSLVSEFLEEPRRRRGTR